MGTLNVMKMSKAIRVRGQRELAVGVLFPIGSSREAPVGGNSDHRPEAAREGIVGVTGEAPGRAANSDTDILGCCKHPLHFSTLVSALCLLCSVPQLFSHRKLSGGGGLALFIGKEAPSFLQLSAAWIVRLSRAFRGVWWWVWKKLDHSAH